MTWASRDFRELGDKAMKRISKEIERGDRNLVWLLFVADDLSLTDPLPGSESQYFLVDEGRKNPPPPRRICVPVPRKTKPEHINILARCLIEDGYDFHGFMIAPGEFIPA